MRLMAAVPVELRSPILPLTARSLSERSLWMGRLGMRVGTKPGRGVTMTERYLDSQPAVRVLITTPTGADKRRPAVLHLHGGGMVVGSPQFEAFESGRLARELDAVVVVTGLPAGARASVSRRAGRLHGDAALDA